MKEDLKHVNNKLVNAESLQAKVIEVQTNLQTQLRNAATLHDLEKLNKHVQRLPSIQITNALAERFAFYVTKQD
jgi:hypothetical protein